MIIGLGLAGIAINNIFQESAAAGLPLVDKAGA